MQHPCKELGGFVLLAYWEGNSTEKGYVTSLMSSWYSHGYVSGWFFFFQSYCKSMGSDALFL